MFVSAQNQIVLGFFYWVANLGKHPALTQIEIAQHTSCNPGDKRCSRAKRRAVRQGDNNVKYRQIRH